MARETKIGLLVGLGVIIFIGILVSDHLSLAQRQGFTGLTSTADAGSLSGRQQPDYAPPIAQRRDPLPDPGLTQTDDTAQTDHAAARRVDLPYEIYRIDPTHTPQHVQQQTQRQQPEPDVLVIRAQGNDTTNATRDPAPLADQVHHVQPGETLSAIAQKYYGDRNYWRTIYDANRDRIPSPRALRVGVRLVIPQRGGARVQPQVADRQTEPAPTSGFKQYTIAPGDTLSVLAQKFLGSQRYTDKLYELNRSVIRDPDRLVVGTVIRIPAQ